jgi:hypothetical protein
LLSPFCRDQLHNRNKNKQRATAKYRVNIGALHACGRCIRSGRFHGPDATAEECECRLLARFPALASQNKKPRAMPGLLLMLRDDQYRATSGPLNL